MITNTRRPVERSGLHKRPQMEQIVHYLAMHQEKVKFPDRTALFIRNHPFMTQLDFFDMQEAQEMQWEEQQQQHNALEAARQMGQGVAEAEARQHNRRQIENAGYYGRGVNWDDDDDDLFQDADDGYGDGGNYGRDNWARGGGGREEVVDNFYERMRQQAADFMQNQRAMQEDARQQLRQQHGTIPMIYHPANQARARGSGLTQEQRQAGQMAQQGQYALPQPNPEAYVPLIPQYVHRMGFGEMSLVVPPQPSPAHSIRDIPMYQQRRRSRSNSDSRVRYSPTDRNIEDRPNPRRGLGVAPAATVAPTPQRRSSRSNSRGGLRTRWESEGNPFAGVARRGQLGDTPFAPVAPVAPKMAPRPVDPNVRLGYPPGMPAPQARASPKAPPMPTLSSAPADHGGAVVATRPGAKAPMRPDDTRRMLDRSRLSGALAHSRSPPRKAPKRKLK